MIDTSLSPAMTPDWQDVLTYGDVVSFRFPVAEADDNEAPKARPCLVLDIETIGGRRVAVLAYGTSADTRANTGYEVAVRGAETRAAAGLDRPTRFVGARRIMVPLTHGGFAICSATGAPVLGRLTGDAFERMNCVRARIHAERDIAADRRAQRRSRRTRKMPGRNAWPLRGRDFTVEHRPSARAIIRPARPLSAEERKLP